MKTSNLLGGALLASSFGSHNLVEGKTPVKSLILATKGACNGALSTSVRSVATDLLEAKGKTHEDRSHPLITPVGQKAARNFPVSFCSNALSTALLDRVFKASTADTVKNIHDLALPVACSEIAKELLSDVKIAPHAKAGLAYGAFWAGRLAQGKNPVQSAIAVSGFAAGASLVKQMKKAKQSEATQHGVYTSAVSGFISPETKKSSDLSPPQSRDDYIRARYQLKPTDKIWEGPDGSLFIPISDSTKH